MNTAADFTVGVTAVLKALSGLLGALWFQGLCTDTGILKNKLKESTDLSFFNDNMDSLSFPLTPCHQVHPGKTLDKFPSYL